MKRISSSILALVLVATSAAVSAREVLKVCADPFNMPMSNKAREGYENKLAELVAEKLGIPEVQYEWFPQRIGFIRNTLRNDETEDGSYKCDLVMGVIENFELAATTRPYMRSTWAMAYVKGRGLDFIQSQEDLKDLTEEQKSMLRIGVFDRGTATDWVFMQGLMEQAVPYQSMSGDARETPGKMIERELLEDKINLTFVWGPIAGPTGKSVTAATGEEVVVIPLLNEPGLKFDYQISMAVRHPDKEFRAELDRFIEENQAEIDALLTDYGVPLLPVRYAGPQDDDD